jgi:hypothetical protein
MQHGLVTFGDKRRPGTADYTLEVSLEMQHGLVTFSDKPRPGTADYTLEVSLEIQGWSPSATSADPAQLITR